MFAKTVVLTTSVVLLTGCLSTRSYVDPGFGAANYDEIAAVAAKHPVALDVTFQKNGESFEKARQEVTNLVSRTLRATGVFDLDKESPDSSLLIVINNIGNKSGAAAKGFGTGLTFGAIGSSVTDNYEFSIEYIDRKGKHFKSAYRHALHTTIGNKSAPVETVQATSPNAGFATIVEQVLLKFVEDMQRQGLLSNNAAWPFIRLALYL